MPERPARPSYDIDEIPSQSLGTLSERSGVVLDSADGLTPATPISDLTSGRINDEIALSDAKLRKTVAIAIVTAFILANGAVLTGVWFMFQDEVRAIQGHVYEAKERIITSALLMTLVGATTVQLGALSILMGKYLFPSPKS